MNDTERFVLDARIADVISDRAFRAELRNGHRFTAFVASWDEGRMAGPERGDRVDVECSPYDMSKARIVRVHKAED